MSDGLTVLIGLSPIIGLLLLIALFCIAEWRKW